MPKKKTPASEFFQDKCVIPNRIEKLKALKEGNDLKFLAHAKAEEICKDLRNKSKK